MSSDTRAVRESEQLDWPRIEQWLRERLPDADVPGLDLAEPFAVEQFPGGHSNLTYLVRFGATEMVLRRPPLGPVAPTAHDMAREFRWLTAVHPVYPLAPRVVCPLRRRVGRRVDLLRDGAAAAESSCATKSRRRSRTGPSVRHAVSGVAGRCARGSARHRSRIGGTAAPRQAGRLRRASGARLDRALAAFEDERARRDGAALAVADRAAAAESRAARRRPRRLQARQPDARRRTARRDWSASSTGR